MYMATFLWQICSKYRLEYLYLEILAWRLKPWFRKSLRSMLNSGMWLSAYRNLSSFNFGFFQMVFYDYCFIKTEVLRLVSFSCLLPRLWLAELWQPGVFWDHETEKWNKQWGRINHVLVCADRSRALDWCEFLHPCCCALLHTSHSDYILEWTPLTCCACACQLHFAVLGSPTDLLTGLDGLQLPPWIDKSHLLTSACPPWSTKQLLVTVTLGLDFIPVMSLAHSTSQRLISTFWM